MRNLTSVEIDKLASRANVKRVAVENFLGTLFDSTAREAYHNLQADARSYKWNAATVRAIEAGITLASKP